MEGQPPGHWVKEERNAETSGHEEIVGEESKRKGSHSKSKNVELRGRGQNSLDLKARHVIKIQHDFTTAFQFNMGCISFFNVISKHQLKSSLNINAMKHGTDEN